MNHKTNDTPPETSPNALYSRRGVAIIAAGAALTLAVPAISFAAPTSDEVRRQRDLERQARQGLQWEKRVRPGSRSANGWPIELEADAGGDVATRRIPGSEAAFTSASGAAATILLYVAQRIHYEVRPLTPGDVVGHFTSGTTGHGDNHRSGTAIDIGSSWGDSRGRGAFYLFEREVVQSIVSSTQGAVRWSGSAAGNVNETHFEISMLPSNPRLGRIAESLAGTAGRGVR
jgi:hypothetical protein